MIKIIITGASGKMGKTLIDLIARDPKLELCGAIDTNEIGTDVGQGVKISADLASIIALTDVVIDFSSTLYTPTLLEICASAKKALVVGTTGHSKNSKKLFNDIAKNIPLLVSPNMSIGVNLLWKLAEISSKTLDKEYKIEILERHHIHKKDAPSGTAKRLIEIVANSRGLDIENDVSFSENKKLEEINKPIQVQAIREGEIIGEHILSLNSQKDRIELGHFAYTREIFANGALRATKWIVDKKPGLYNMQDVLFEKGA